MSETNRVACSYSFSLPERLGNIAICDEITAVYWNWTQVVSLSMVKFWTKEFKEGRASLTDKEMSGRPRIQGLADRVKAYMAENPFVSQKKLAKLFDVDQKQRT